MERNGGIGPGLLENAGPACAADLPESIAAIRRFLAACTAQPLSADEWESALCWNMVVAPPPGVISPRRGYYSMIDKIEAPDPRTVVFRLKYATAAFLPALADPFVFIYKREIIDRDPFEHSPHSQSLSRLEGRCSNP